MNNIHEGTFYFDPNEKIFIHHFPGNPVVPGSMIISSFLNKIQKIFNCSCNNLIVRNFKFIRFIPPGSYNFKILLKDGCAYCELFENNQIVSKGKIFVSHGK